jgi:hypothetical protein
MAWFIRHSKSFESYEVVSPEAGYFWQTLTQLSLSGNTLKASLQTLLFAMMLQYPSHALPHWPVLAGPAAMHASCTIVPAALLRAVRA